MLSKALEVRDRMTFVPVLAVQLVPNGLGQRYLLQRVGYRSSEVMLTKLSGETIATADVHHWGDRTMSVAHRYIRENFDRLLDGDVVDVEFILGETKELKRSERYDGVPS